MKSKIIKQKKLGLSLLSGEVAFTFDRIECQEDSCR